MAVVDTLLPWIVVLLVAIEAFVLGHMIGWGKGFAIGKDYGEMQQADTYNRISKYWKK